MKLFLLFFSLVIAQEYPIYTKTQWESDSLSPSTRAGWKLTGELNIQVKFESSPPDLQVITRLSRTINQPRWVDNGFYQTYV